MTMTRQQSGRQLYDRGYRCISNRFRIVARLDQDIREFVKRDADAMRKRHGHPNWSAYTFLLRLPFKNAEDWFRRCVSKDRKL